MRTQSKIFTCDVDIELGCFWDRNGVLQYGITDPDTGYRKVSLTFRHNKQVTKLYAHRAIVMEANRLTKLPEGFCVHHRDENRKNNGISNLCLCTYALNNYYAAKRRDYKAITKKRLKLGYRHSVTATTDNDVKIVFPSKNQCARHFGVNCGRITNIIQSKKFFNNISRLRG